MARGLKLGLVIKIWVSVKLGVGFKVRGRI
jgi:hypothetical protein